MNIDIDKIEIVFNNYIEECRQKIKNTIFKEEELIGFLPIKNKLIIEGKIDKESSIDDAIKYERLSMINQKIDHTKRVVKESLNLAKKIGTPLNYNKVLYVSALLHDIGRFDQATWNNSFNDSCYKGFDNIKNHAHAGYHILFDEGRIKEYGLDDKIKPLVGSVIYNHSVSVLTDDLALKFNNVNELDIEILNKVDGLNNIERVITAALVQMVRDVDMLDIFYQNITGEIPVVKDFIDFKINNDTLDDISKHWGISKYSILKYNGIEESDFKNRRYIKIPLQDIDLRKLEVPNDIRDKFYNNEEINLRELRDRQDWTFIMGMWWKLGHFLSNINFTFNFKILSENKVLDKIYNKYPDEYKFLVSKAFTFAKEILINKRLEDNNSNIYVDYSKKLVK